MEIEMLQNMFPNIDPGVVGMILENVNNNVEQASEILMDMVRTDSINTSSAAEFPTLNGVSTNQRSETFRNAVLESPKRKAVEEKSSGIRTTKNSLGAIGSKIGSSELGQSPEIEECIEDISQNEKVLVILRGLPGSGKSTLSKKLSKLNENCCNYSTDDYFYINGHYIFKPDDLPKAHKWNQDRTLKAMEAMKPLIIIDNTNTMSWEMRPYIELGVNFKYKMHILEPNTSWKFKPGILSKRNCHGVPKQKIEMMLDRYEKNLKVDELLEKWQLTEKPESSETEEVFISDSEESEENTDHLDQVDFVADEELAVNLLNPEVQEFVPENIAQTIDSTEVNNEQVDMTEHDEIASLMNIFPHLSIEQVTEMYESQTVNMTLDPNFANTLQNYFGSPAPPQYLMKLPQEQMLSLDISLSFAKLIFTIWQQNVLAKLNDDKILSYDNNLTDSPPDEVGTLEAGATTSTAKTVLAPNAVSHYENQMMKSAIKASLRLPIKKSPMIIVRENGADEDGQHSEHDIDQMIVERDMLYRKSIETKGPHMQGAASYYASKARELNAMIKNVQREKQMEMFLTINKGCPKTRIDLHYLQTGEAIKQLQHFIGQWDNFVNEGKKTCQTVEVITGRGNRSDNGKSRLRPAVSTWLNQKNYQYSEVNDGCFKVTISPRRN